MCICRFICSHVNLHMCICKCAYMLTSMICNEPNTVETDLPPFMNNFQICRAVNFCLQWHWILDDVWWTLDAVCCANTQQQQQQQQQQRQKSDRYSTAELISRAKKRCPKISCIVQAISTVIVSACYSTTITELISYLSVRYATACENVYRTCDNLANNDIISLLHYWQSVLCYHFIHRYTRGGYVS